MELGDTFSRHLFWDYDNYWFKVILPPEEWWLYKTFATNLDYSVPGAHHKSLHPPGMGSAWSSHISVSVLCPKTSPCHGSGWSLNWNVLWDLSVWRCNFWSCRASTGAQGELFVPQSCLAEHLRPLHLHVSVQVCGNCSCTQITIKTQNN